MRKLATFSFSFAAGVFLLRYGFLAALLLPLAALCALVALTRRFRFLIIGAGLALAVLWSCGYDAVIRAPATALAGQTQTITATVTDYPQPTTLGVSATIRLGPACRALVYLEPEYEALRPGDQITLTAYFKPSDGQHGAATDRYSSKGIYLIAYARGDVSYIGPARTPWTCLPAVWSHWLRSSILEAFPADTAPLVAAIVTGNRAALSDGFTTSLQRTGLAHAVAVSGMHISFLAGLVYTLSGRYRKRTALIGLPMLLTFMLVVGCTPSVVRAVVMQSLFLVAPLFSRESDTATNLSFALMVLLLQNPYAAASVSLQLSFLAVAGIMLFSQRLYDPLWKRLPWKNWATKFLLGTLTTSLGAIALTTPLMALYFGGVSLIAPLSNLLTLWAVSVTFVGGLIAAFIHPVALLVAPVVGYLNWVIPILAAVPFATVAVTGAYLQGWLVAAYAMLVTCLAWKGTTRPIVPVSLGAILLCLALVLNSLTYEWAGLTLTVLDVGQGQSVLIRSGDRVALVDCGGNSRGNAGDAAADYLADRNRTTVDLLVLTHYHDDHAGGVLELLDRVSVAALAVPDLRDPGPLGREILAAAGERGVQILTVDDDLTLDLGGAQLTLYASLGAGDANEEGLSVLCEAQDFSALLTGDMDATVEKRLVKYGDLPQVDLLVAGHHGAKNSTSQHLLDAVRPQMVAISVGDNTYGHPHPDTLARVANTGADIYRTDLQGNLTITAP